METPCLTARCRTQPLWNSGGERPRWPSRGAPCFRFSSLHTQWLGRSCEGPDPPWLPITCRTVCPLLPTAAWTCPSTKLPPCPLLPLPFPPAPPPAMFFPSTPSALFPQGHGTHGSLCTARASPGPSHGSLLHCIQASAQMSLLRRLLTPHVLPGPFACFMLLHVTSVPPVCSVFTLLCRWSHPLEPSSTRVAWACRVVRAGPLAGTLLFCCTTQPVLQRILTTLHASQ